MSTPTALREFLRKATYYHSLEEFDRDERIYKLRLAHYLQEVAEALTHELPETLDLLATAIKSKDDNLINWRDQARLINWIRSTPHTARVALADLWDARRSLDDRLDSVEAVLRSSGLSQPGTQLIVVSTLLMALTPYEHPPVRTRPFRATFRELGVPGFMSSDSLAERYKKALGLLDYLLAQAGTLLRDRLDAQSVIWCVQGRGWDDVPPDYEPDRPDPRAVSAAVLAADPDTRHAPESERFELHLARQGQGRFRDELWRLWGECVLTGCRRAELVQAVHIKPWRCSTSLERLDPLNGLLLLPTLHAALDAGLIGFQDDGRLLISRALSAVDARVIGLRRGMRLRSVPEQMAGYLRYHRANTFRPR